MATVNNNKDRMMDLSLYVRCSVISACAILVVNLVYLPARAAETEAIQVQFETSCSDAVQSEFNEAITLLHSFEYPETTRRFNQIIEKDPACAMARWGAAMSIWHPLWAPPSKAELEQGANILADSDGLQTTPREAAYINAAKAFFSSNDIKTHRRRAEMFEARMADLYAENLDDPEAAAFYALALLASADPRDKSYAHQFKSAGLLNWVKEIYPTHPGALHYLIHSYDYPGLAHLAFESAKIYADAAPDSAHAQHMPSHIFTRLGLWERSLASNHDSTRSAAEYTIRAHLPGHYDEGLHSMDYLMYAMLQTARDDEANALLDTLHGIGKTDTENFKVAFTYASAPARYALERRQWEEASNLELKPTEFLWDDFPWARSIHHFARGIGAARSGQLSRAKEELAIIEKLWAGIPDSTHTYFREEVKVHVDAVTSWILLAEGNSDQALQMAAAAADREDAIDKHPVTPGEVIPARELFADMLFESGKHAMSLQQYRAVLSGSPNRLNALLGAGNAASRIGDDALAEQFFAQARKQTKEGDRQRTGLDKAWTTSR